MAVAREPGRAGRAAGVEVCGDVVALDVATADEVIVGFAGDEGGEAVRVRGDAKHGAQRRHPRANARRLRPDASVVLAAPGDQHLRASRVQHRYQLLVRQQRIERLHDARCFAAPQGELVFETAGQEHGHRVTRPHPEPVQQIRRLVDAGQQPGIGPAHRLGIDRGQEGQRGLVAERARRIPEDLVGAAHRQRLHQRDRLEPANVGEDADRKRRRERWSRRAHGGAP